MVIFHSYVSLPEGKSTARWELMKHQIQIDWTNMRSALHLPASLESPSRLTVHLEPGATTQPRLDLRLQHKRQDKMPEVSEISSHLIMSRSEV